MAVIIGTEFCSSSRKTMTGCSLVRWWIQGIVMVLLLGGWWEFSSGAAAAAAADSKCELARVGFTNRGLEAVLPNLMDNVMNGPICGEGSCCGVDLENELIRKSRNHTERFLRSSISKLHSLFETRAKRFDDFFRDMMTKSKREFHSMFQKTYGVIYLQNSYVFTDFFDELEKYYNKGQTKLTEVMDTFFGILYQRMFVVINSQYQFNDTYLVCVAEHMNELKPFGDVPHKLGVQLRRSFVATRTFYLALLKGATIAQNMMALEPHQDCWREITAMRYCGVCRGEENPAPCLEYCASTLQGCLKQFAILDNHWDNYIEAVDKVADRLLGPFNIEMVVEPINIKISEAIMNFQESGAEVSKRIFSGCGEPRLGRRRRDTNEQKPKAKGEISLESLSFNNNHGKKKHKKADNTPTLEKLIREIKTKVKETRQFWIHLPYQFCNMENVTVQSSETDVCWNGTFVSKTAQDHPLPLLVPEQSYALQVMAGKLQSAYQGQDVDLADDEVEEPLAGSGSGSGDGSDETIISSGDGGSEVVFETSAPTHPPPPTTTRAPDRTRTTASTASTMSLTRALAHYILPIVLVCFGGAISDLL